VQDQFRSLDSDERLAGVGALGLLVSLLLPWYGIPGSDGVVKTGLGSFGWIQLAIMVTIGAAFLLLYECSRGRVLPAPFREGTLLAACGGWAAVLVIFRMFDRPGFDVAGLPSPNLRYGVFLGFAGACLLGFAGLRKRRAEGLARPPQ
jgi:hypothetical protein